MGLFRNGALGVSGVKVRFWSGKAVLGSILVALNGFDFAGVIDGW